MHHLQCTSLCTVWGCAETRSRLVNIQVGKLAKKLPVGDVRAMAAQLGGAQGAAPAVVVDTTDIDEDDLT